MIITLELPFPPPILNPNCRKHWARKLKSKTAQKEAGIVAAIAYRGVFPGWKKIPIELMFYPPDRRKRDADNLLASVKALLDGVAIGLGVDDKAFGPITVSIQAALPSQGSVILRLGIETQQID